MPKKKKNYAGPPPPPELHIRIVKIKISCTRVHAFEEKSKFHVPGYMDLKKKQNIKCVSAGARIRRSFRYHLLHPLILKLLVLCAPADLETQSSPGCTCTHRYKFLTHSLLHNTWLPVSTEIKSGPLF